MGGDDLGDVAERGERQAGAVNGEAGDPRRGVHPKGDQHALAPVALAPAPAAIGGGGIGAVAEVAERVEEDRPRRRGIRILGLDRRRDREHGKRPVGHGEIDLPGGLGTLTPGREEKRIVRGRESKFILLCLANSQFLAKHMGFVMNAA
jgi:hypothetical protein